MLLIGLARSALWEKSDLWAYPKLIISFDCDNDAILLLVRQKDLHVTQTEQAVFSIN